MVSLDGCNIGYNQFFEISIMPHHRQRYKYALIQTGQEILRIGNQWDVILYLLTVHQLLGEQSPKNVLNCRRVKQSFMHVLKQ